MADESIKEALEQFKLCEEAEHDNRRAALEDLKFARLGEQWPEAIRAQREAQQRPCLTINRMPAFIRQVVNDSRQNKPSIIFHPVEGGDVETAEVMNGLMRNIEYTSNADIAYDTAIDFAVSMGFGYIRVDTEYSYDDAFTQDIRILQVPNPFAVYGDPLSTSADGSDWKVAFVTDILKKKEFERQYKGAKTESVNGNNDALSWFGEDGIRVAEWWKKEDVDAKLVQLSDGMVMFEADYLRNKDVYDVQGLQVVGARDTKTCKVTQKIISGAEELETNEWAGKYIPIVPVYGDEVNVEGKRHFLSLIRFAKDAQQMHNFWRTASTELVALAPKAPWVGPKGSFESDADKWATANTATHSHLEYDPVEGQPGPSRQPFAGVPAGALQEALNASDDMKAIMGLYDASIGARSNETSGKAIMARQREGDVSTFHFIDNMTRAVRQVGRICGDLIPKVYNQERTVRVIGEDGTNDMVKVNGEFEKDGKLKMYDLTAGKYDLVVKSGPSFTTRREEAATQMMELLRVFPQAAPIIGDLVASNLDWPGADEITKRLKAMLPPNLQDESEIPPHIQQMIEQGKAQMQQMGQAIQQLQQENEQLKQEHGSKMAELALKQQESADKAQIDALSMEIKSRELAIKEREVAIKEKELILREKELEIQAWEKVHAALNPPVAQPGDAVPQVG